MPRAQQLCPRLLQPTKEQNRAPHRNAWKNAIDRIQIAKTLARKDAISYPTFIIYLNREKAEGLTRAKTIMNDVAELLDK
ncbi:MAG: hypothetical protein VYA34_13475 [Myxococcota bacterium]|nr:hypothetical protein [Myxococcota bacterium]